MACPKCSYELDAFAEECPKCHGRGIAERKVKPTQPSHWERNRRRRLALLSLVACLIASVLLGLAGFNTYTRVQRDNVLEAVLRYRIAHDHYGGKADTLVFVSVEDKDPNTALVNRFKDGDFSVRKWSQAKRVANPIHRNSGHLMSIYKDIYINKGSGEIGAPMALGEPRWSSPFRALVSSDVANGISDYIVTRKNGRWIVDDVVIVMIS